MTTPDQEDLVQHMLDTLAEAATVTFWLSFADHGFKGVAVVEVTSAEAEEARAFLLPQSRPHTEWLIAAVRKSHVLGCNPGGQVLGSIIPDNEETRAIPRGRLLSDAELERWGVSVPRRPPSPEGC